MDVGAKYCNEVRVSISIMPCFFGFLSGSACFISWVWVLIGGFLFNSGKFGGREYVLGVGRRWNSDIEGLFSRVSALRFSFSRRCRPGGFGVVSNW